MQINGFFSKKRIISFFIVTLLFVIYIIYTYAKLSFEEPSKISPTSHLPERGTIFDRNGKVLAIQTNFYHVGISPSGIKDASNTAKLIAPSLNISADNILRIIKNTNGDFSYLKKRINQSEYNEIYQIVKENGLTGIRFDKIPGRIYPGDSLASQVIGFMGTDGQGLSGIELTKDSILSPQTKSNEPNQKGSNIYLTIDANLQYKLEKIAQKSLDNTKAESFTLLAVSSKTGEILSYISLPAANLNAYPQSSEIEKIDRPTCVAYEPGSVFKIFSVALFLTSNAIDETDTFFCDGKFEITSGNEKIRISCLDHHGWLTARDALKYSCNDAIAQMSENISSDLFLHYIRSMGFGEKIGIELPAETPGSVKDSNHKYWSSRSKPTMSIGQEISVSALQMVQATTAIANKGYPIKLTLINRIESSDGNIEYQHQPQILEPIFTSKSADYVISSMETTAKSGTGTKALLGDVSIGVKTGTAQMTDTKTGKYSTTDFLSSCMAIFPTENPEIILYITISKAQGETYGGRIVAPVIAEAANIIIDHLGFARGNAVSISHSGKISIIENSVPNLEDTVPDYTGYSKRQLTSLLQRKDINVNIIGDGWVINQNPPAGTAYTENMTIELYLKY